MAKSEGGIAKFVIGAGGVVVIILALVFVFGVRGCSKGFSILGGNVYSEGYRDGYIQGVTEKREGAGGLSYVGEVKMSFHGFGGAVDPQKSGQTPTGAWAANFYDESVKKQCEAIRGDQLVRVYYKEKEVAYEGSTNYEVTKVVLLPAAGEPIPKENK